MIGKAIIKVTLQCCFVVLSFSDQYITYIIGTIGQVSPALKDLLKTLLNKQKESLYSHNSDEAKPLIGQIWEVLVTLMILYFIISIVHSLVQQYLREEKEESSKKRKGKK